MEDQEKTELDPSAQKRDSLIKFGGLLLVLMFLWYGLDLAEVI